MKTEGGFYLNKHFSSKSNGKKSTEIGNYKDLPLLMLGTQIQDGKQSSSRKIT